MPKLKIKIRINKERINKELDDDNVLTKIREELLDEITFPFIFCNEDEEEISKENESTIILKNILDGSNLYLKKEKIKRNMKGQKIKSENGLDFYVYPQKELTEMEKKRSSNIMVIGETGVGKSTWLHCFLNYLQGIQIEENNRYLLFDEGKLQKEYEIKTGKKKTKGCSVTDKPAIYNIEPTMLSENPIRLIDTAGFGDVRPGYDKQIIEDIQELFTKEIETLNAICLIYKATETRAHDRAKQVLDKLFSLFGEEIKKNIVIVFTFVDDFDDFSAIQTLQDEDSPFIKILGNINDLAHFEFNNKAYTTKNKEGFAKIFNNNSKSYGRLLKHVFSLPSISLESSKKVIKNRFDISNKIINICNELSDVINNITASLDNRKSLEEFKLRYETQKESPYKQIQVKKTRPKVVEEKYIDYLSSGWYVLYCTSCGKVCHHSCKGPKEGLHSSEYGCKTIGTLSCKCSNCDCHYSKHSFHNYIERSRNKTIFEEYIDWVDDQKSIANEEEKKKKREELSILIKEKEEEIRKLDKKIHDSLNDSLDKLSIISSKEIELDKIALKKYEIKNGYCKELLKGTIQEKNIQEILNTTLDDIESICSSNERKEESIRQIQKKLNKK